jgi:hypothetical protein
MEISGRVVSGSILLHYDALSHGQNFRRLLPASYNTSTARALEGFVLGTH